MKNLLFFLTGLFLFLSCAGTRQQQPAVEGEERTVAAPLPKMFSAAKEYLQDRGYVVLKANAETGDIETDYKPGAGWSDKSLENANLNTKVSGYWERLRYEGRPESAKHPEKRARIKVKALQIDETHTRLILYIFSEVKDFSSGWQLLAGDNREARLLYDRFFREIFKKAKERIPQE
ncbi:MAG TPA: hypothetical protein ENH29_10845 [Bacteroidetes bacterium]|nr:hypothetical protein [Bacteroidota bacterium]